MSGAQFTTVLPHEPLPGSSSCGINGDGGRDVRGFVHLQGAFVPRRKEGNKDECNNACTNSESTQFQGQGGSDIQSEPTPKCCRCGDVSFIETTLRTNLQLMLPNWGMDATDIRFVEALRESPPSEQKSGNSANTVSKVRITLSTPARARTITARLRRGAYSPRDFLSSRTEQLRKLGGSNGVDNEGLCPHGCGGRYAGRPLQVTQIAPTNIADMGRDGDDDNAAGRWARAAPPKFRRLQLSTDAAALGGKNALTEEELERRRADTRFVRVENLLTGSSSLEDVKFWNDDGSEEETSEKMKVLKNDLLSIFHGKSTSGTTDKESQLHRGMVEDDVRHAFQEMLREAIRQVLVQTRSHPKRSQNNDDLSKYCRGVELFMKSDTAIGKKNKGNKNKTKNSSDGGDSGGMTLYDHLHVGMRSNTDATQLIQSWQGRRLTLSMKLPNLFLERAGMSANMPMAVTIVTGKLYLDYADVQLPRGRQTSGVPRNTKASSSAQTSERTRGEPSRSECTSATSHVRVPGLRLVPNYVSKREERIMLAALTGPHAPWAPPQHTPSGGRIRRRVQHYGYVFDYESADVLRRSNGEGISGDGSAGHGGREACPPLPSMKSLRQSVVEMTDEDVERWISEAADDVRGWEALAGVIERTRRFDFASSSSPADEKMEGKMNDVSLDEEGFIPEGVPCEETSSLPLQHSNGSTPTHPRINQLSSNKGGLTLTGIAREETSSASLQRDSGQTYPHINQLTINEYTPGQGIGSHVDTETAFGDGLLIITLNGGIVMEFRKVSAANDDTDGRKLLYLPPRSLVLLSSDARYEWEHMIVSRTTDTVEGTVLPRNLRVSLTLRTALTAPAEGRPASPLPLYESKVFPPRWGQLSDDASRLEAKFKLDDSSNKRADLVTPDTESKHVHDVYNAIATQWHHTRGKRGVLWPGATRFLENLPKGSIVADVGCGDGKYFPAIWASGSYVIGTDISEPLLRTAAASTTTTGGDDSGNKCADGPQHQRLSDEKRALGARPAVAVADCIHLPLRSDGCDAAICIAVMHHLSTEGRRVRCLSELRRIVKPGGLINVQAWALEQEDDSKRKFHGTDVLVPFNAQPKYLQTSEKENGRGNESESAGPAAKGSGGKGVAQMMAERYDGAAFDGKKNLVVFQRYCHMYRRGELEGLCERAAGLEVVESSYERGNHVVLLRVL